jgi:hypothetical protein
LDFKHDNFAFFSSYFDINEVQSSWVLQGLQSLMSHLYFCFAGAKMTWPGIQRIGLAGLSRSLG